MVWIIKLWYSRESLKMKLEFYYYELLLCLLLQSHINRVPKFIGKTAVTIELHDVQLEWSKVQESFIENYS